MTRKQFEKFRVEIETNKFQSVEINPIRFAIERLIFEKQKLTTLITAAEAIPMKTTLAKAARWKRKLQRADVSLLRLQKAKEETDAARTFAAQSGQVPGSLLMNNVSPKAALGRAAV